MDNIIFGIRPVAEAIEAGRQIEKLYIRKGAEGQLMTELKDLCIRHRVRMQEVPVEKLNRLTRGNHQGVVAQISAIEYVGLADILERVPEDETPLVVIFDGVTDVRNFGAIARSAECALDIDLARAEAALHRAEPDLEARGMEMNISTPEAARARAKARIRAAELWRKNG